MDKVIFLSKQNCPKCVSLKKYFELALKNKYAENIEVITLEENQEIFMEYVFKFQLASMPALIYKDDILTDTSPLKVTEFIEKHIG